MQACVEHIGRYYLGNGDKEASYNAGVESGKLAIDAGLLFTGASEFDVLRTGAVDVGKAASAAERVGLKDAEVATNVAKADRIAAEAPIAAESSLNIIIPAKPLANSGAPYANAEASQNWRNGWRNSICE